VCGAAGGQFQLKRHDARHADAVLESVRLLANATAAFTEMCLAGMEADAESCQESVEKEPCDGHGFEPIPRLRACGGTGEGGVRHGQDNPRTCAIEKNVLPEEQLNEALDPWRMTRPQP